MLMKQGFEVLLASDGDALQLLQLEFPELTSFELPSYNIEYGHHFAFSVLKRVPHILKIRLKESVKPSKPLPKTLVQKSSSAIIVTVVILHSPKTFSFVTNIIYWCLCFQT
jgi:hypothetical protein